MIVAREPLAKSEVEIAVANVATLLVSASRMVSGEVMPNFEAIVEQNEMIFAQKRKDLSTVNALLNDADAVVPTLQRAAEMIRNMCDFSEAMIFDSIASLQIPAKPLPEGSLLRDTLRRLHYVQKVVEAVAKWLNDVGEHEYLKESVLYTKIQHELIRTFKRVVIQVQQATVIIGKYRDMGDIRVLREMTLDAQAVLSELKKADESVSEKRKSISLFKRAIEEGKAAPKIVRQLASVTAGLVVVVALSFAVIKLNALAPQVFPMPDPTPELSLPPIEQEIQIPTHENGAPQPPIKPETAATPKENTLPVKSETPIAKAVEAQREEAISVTTKLAPPVTTVQPNMQTKPEAKEPNLNKPDAQKPKASVVQAKSDEPATPVVTNVSTSKDKGKSIPPPVKKATSNPTEKAIEKTTEQKSATTKVWKEKEATSQKNSERALPKRKTIVIED